MCLISQQLLISQKTIFDTIFIFYLDMNILLIKFCCKVYRSWDIQKSKNICLISQQLLISQKNIFDKIFIFYLDMNILLNKFSCKVYRSWDIQKVLGTDRLTEWLSDGVTDRRTDKVTYRGALLLIKASPLPSLLILLK